MLQQKLKRKLDSSSVPQTTGEGGPPLAGAHIDHYNFENDQSPPAKKPAPNTATPNANVPQSQNSSSEQQHCVSVNIDVQQISNASSRVENSSSSQIKLTFQSTLHTATGTNNNKQEQQQQQPATAPGAENTSSNSSYQDSIGLEDVGFEELNDILDQLEKENGSLPAEFLKEIEEVGLREQSQDPNTQLKDNSDQFNVNKASSKVNNLQQQQFTGDNSVKNNSPASGMFAEPVYDQHAQSGYCTTGAGTGTGSVPSGATAAAMPPTSAAAGYRPTHPAGPSPPLGPIHGDVPPLPTLGGDTGPAAETLKQMAAQHQSQDYNKHGYDNYDYRRYPGTYPQHQGYMGAPHQANMYPYNQQMAAAGRPQYMGHMKPGADMTGYGGTKPLTHYPAVADGQGSGSSLQRLQNQVTHQLPRLLKLPSPFE